MWSLLRTILASRIFNSRESIELLSRLGPPRPYGLGVVFAGKILIGSSWPNTSEITLRCIRLRELCSHDILQMRMEIFIGLSETARFVCASTSLGATNSITGTRFSWITLGIFRPTYSDGKPWDIIMTYLTQAFVRTAFAEEHPHVFHD